MQLLEGLRIKYLAYSIQTSNYLAMKLFCYICTRLGSLLCLCNNGTFAMHAMVFNSFCITLGFNVWLHYLLSLGCSSILNQQELTNLI